MKHFILILISLLYSLQFVSAQTLNKSLVSSQRLAYAAAKRLMGTNNTYKYYVSKTMVQKDGESRWLVFVDKLPRAGWEHPCSYVYAKPGDSTVDNCIVVDSVCPPSDVRFVPILKSNDDTDNLENIKVAVGKPSTASEHTYAVILSGGNNINSNSSRYWNDCSFIYKTLRNKYGIDKEHIKVLMSDGTDPADDIHNENGSFYFSSPLDLDGDGNPDIEYSATKENLRKVISDLSETLDDTDHLFIYVIDHGGYEWTNGGRRSYVCMWNEEKLYPDELNSYLDGCEAGYVSILMGQCYSGGFVSGLKADNRIVIAACGEDERSYGCEEKNFDEFVYHWTCGLNGFDENGNELEDFPQGSNHTLNNAYAYACGRDVYYTSPFGEIRETPSITLFSGSTAEDLAMDTIPNVVDLYITSGKLAKTPTPVAKLMTVTGKKKIVSPVVMPYRPTMADMQKVFINTPFWDNSDVWVRHQDDGRTNFENQAGCLDSDSSTVYIYVNVANRGVKAYDTDNCVLKIWWARSAMKITSDAWLGKKTSMAGGVYGNPIDPKTIHDVIQPGASVIKSVSKEFKDDFLDYAHREDFNMCVLAYLTYDVLDGDPNFTDDTLRIPAVWRTNKLAQKNQTTLIWETLGQKFNATVYVPYERNSNPLSISVIPSSDSKSLFKDMRVNMSVPKGAVSNWTPTYSLTPSQMKTVSTKKLTNVALYDSCSVNNIVLSGKKACAISLSAVPDATENLDGSKDYKFSLALFDDETGYLLGGQSYVIHRGPREKIDFSIDKTLNSGNYTLEATNVSEDVEYRWYDGQGKLVGTGKTCSVPASGASSTYTLETVSKSDGAVASKEISVEHVSKISSVKADGKTLDISLSSPAAPNTSLKVLSANGNTPVSSISVAEGEERCIMSLPDTGKGVCSVTLLENDKPVDKVSFSK